VKDREGIGGLPRCRHRREAGDAIQARIPAVLAGAQVDAPGADLGGIDGGGKALFALVQRLLDHRVALDLQRQRGNPVLQSAQPRCRAG